MLCRVLLAAIALSYLVCVLFLSGIQKEDLDVSLLKKLRHHNVDLDALDDKKLRSECANVTRSKLYNKSAPIEYTNTITKDENTDNETGPSIAATDNKETLSSKEVLSHALEIWQKYKEYKANKAQQANPVLLEDDQDPAAKTEQHQKDNNEFGIANFLAKFISKQNTDDVQLDTTTESSLIKTLVDKNHAIEEKLASSMAAINMLNENIVTLQNSIKERQRPSEVLTLSSSPTEENNFSRTDMFSANNGAVFYGPLYKEQPPNIQDKPNDSYEPNNDDRKVTVEHPTENLQDIPNQEVLYPTNPDIIETKETEQDTVIPVDIIHKIAKSIKDMVLQDLTKDLKTNTSGPQPPITLSANTCLMSATMASMPVSDTTSDVDITTPRSDDKKMVHDSNVNNFLSLFELFKTAPEKITKESNEKKNITKTIKKPQFQAPRMTPPPLPPLNPYKQRSPQLRPLAPYDMADQFPPLILQNVEPHPMAMISLTPPLKQVKSIPHRLQAKPVMIQTNSEEIKPLPIQMNKRPDTVNINIMLTTQNPHWTKEQRDRWNIMMRYGRNPDSVKDLDHVKQKLATYSNVPIDVLQKRRTNTGHTNPTELEKHNSPTAKTKAKNFVNLDVKDNFNPVLSHDNTFSNIKNSVQEKRPTERDKQYKNVDIKYNRENIANNQQKVNMPENYANKNLKSAITPNYQALNIDSLYNMERKTTDYLPPIIINTNEFPNPNILTLKFAPKSRYLNEKYTFNPTDISKPNYVSFESKSQVGLGPMNMYRDVPLSDNYYRKYLHNAATKNSRSRYEHPDRHSKSVEHGHDFKYREKHRPHYYADTRNTNWNQGLRNYERNEANWHKNKLTNKNYEHDPLPLMPVMTETGLQPSKVNLYPFKTRPKNVDLSRQMADTGDLETKLYHLRQDNSFSGDARRENVNSGEANSEAGRGYPRLSVRGFHEKLEGNDNIAESLRECGPDENCLLQVIARQQAPIVSSRGKYDDTHFKKFLKTQQKVNQMLERILATKSETHSVESL